MSGFAPDPATVNVYRLRKKEEVLNALRLELPADVHADVVRHVEAWHTKRRHYEHVLERIASGHEKRPQVAAKVALGQLPIGALLSSDPEVFCPKCENKGRRVKGPHNQQLPCNVCGYLPGEHPAGPPMKGASS